MRGFRGGKDKTSAFLRHLVKRKLYYSAVPYVKEHLASNSSKGRRRVFDPLIDKVVSEVGIKQFEILPEEFLKRSRGPTLQYILARKYFRKKKYALAIRILEKRRSYKHPISPFAFHLKGVVLSLVKQYERSRVAFARCIKASDALKEKTQDSKKRWQLDINRESCLAGIARNYFAEGEFEMASNAYLNVPKTSLVWPEVIFEEAWSSFYEKNYNRTLGKLVTYKAPIFRFVYNPEIDVLRAFSYFKLCLWDDAEKEADHFYKTYHKDFTNLMRRFSLVKKRTNFFYHLVEARGPQTHFQSPPFEDSRELFKGERSRLLRDEKLSEKGFA